MTDYTNRFEKRARTNKVRRICREARRLSRNTPGAELTSAQLAGFVESLGMSAWDMLTAAAGTLDASPATRRRVVTALHVYQGART